MNVDIEFEAHTCGTCGCVWGFPVTLKKQRLKDGQLFYCPNGHARQFILGHTEEDKLRRERDNLKQQLAYKDDRIREEAERADRERNRANGYKGHATRITKRAKAGVCPCCNRTFQNLANHMSSKHPTFTPMELEDRNCATVQ